MLFVVSRMLAPAPHVPELLEADHEHLGAVYIAADLSSLGLTGAGRSARPRLPSLP